MGFCALSGQVLYFCSSLFELLRKRFASETQINDFETLRPESSTCNTNCVRNGIAGDRFFFSFKSIDFRSRPSQV